MHTQNYVRIAEIIKAVRGDDRDINDSYDVGYLEGTGELVDKLADYMAEENPNFDKTEFMSASGVWFLTGA